MQLLRAIQRRHGCGTLRDMNNTPLRSVAVHAPSPQEIMSVVERSPENVAKHDREQWLGLFSDAALVEDPMGSPPARKDTGALGRFWDTFIAPHDIRFEVARDHFMGHDVFRDAIIHTRIGPKIKIDVPAYLLYQLDDAMQVKRMAAHWQLGQLSLGAMKLGPRAWVAMTLLFGRMIRVMGPAWVAGYLASLWRGIGGRGPRAAAQLGQAIANRDSIHARALFSDDAVVQLGDREVHASRLLELFGDGARLTIDAPVAAGWTTSFRFRVDGGEACAGLALFEFAPGSRKIQRARFFTGETE
jgi:hypothetical protein